MGSTFGAEYSAIYPYDGLNFSDCHDSCREEEGSGSPYPRNACECSNSGQRGNYGVMVGGDAGAYALDGDVGGGLTVLGFTFKGAAGGSVGSAHIGAGLGGLYNSNTGEANFKGKAHIGLGLGIKLAFEVKRSIN